MKERICEVTFKKNDCTYRATIKALTYTEKNYGADMDGNRGIPREFIDSAEVDSIKLIEPSKELEDLALIAFKGDECE